MENSENPFGLLSVPKPSRREKKKKGQMDFKENEIVRGWKGECSNTDAKFPTHSDTKTEEKDSGNYLTVYVDAYFCLA